jgi:uncharacterized BrkB/YihY/UPF0761 family membrane protein
MTGDRVARWRAAARRRVERARTYRPVAFLLVVADEDRSSGGALLAGALAFRLFLWLLPAVLVLVGGLGFLSPEEVEDGASASGLGSYTAAAVEQASAEAQQGRWILLSVGLVALVSTSVTLARTLLVATRLAWQMPMERMQHPARSAAVVIGYLALTVLLAQGATWLRARDYALGLLASLLIVVVFALLGWIALLWLPHPADVTPVGLLPGALLIGVGAQVLHLVSALYLVHRMTSASQLYGALGAAATILLGAYLLARILIAASTLNHTWHVSGLRAAPTWPGSSVRGEAEHRAPAGGSG